MNLVLKKMRGFAVGLLSAVFLLPVAACGGPDSSAVDSGTEGKIEKLSDTDFAQGLSVSGLQSGNVSRTWWKYQGKADASVQPYWELGQ